MQQLDENILVDSTDALTFLDVEAQGVDASEPEAHEIAEEAPNHTDDPVRVYLREMGSVRLLTKQAEIDLARRMERGNLRMLKAISRSPLVRKKALAIFEDIGAGKVRLEDVASVGGADDAVKRRNRNDANRRFKKLAEAARELSAMEQKYVSMAQAQAGSGEVAQANRSGHGEVLAGDAESPISSRAMAGVPGGLGRRNRKGRRTGTKTLAPARARRGTSRSEAGAAGAHVGGGFGPASNAALASDGTAR